MQHILLKAHSSAFLISRYILGLGQAAQNQQRPLCPNRKIYLEIRRADEWLFRFSADAISGLVLVASAASSNSSIRANAR